ncbi:hypothetical protein CDV36_011149 [Fusarium kuroshium]|uniref:Uncharacterized protein n=1 Tax=Fusarium kuroshium TaxID=2010991 RepID=A0A3M2RV94_9HYPO|nr:hypothetical protein CDV36_011149 [Fusarium kuroshium]
MHMDQQGEDMHQHELMELIYAGYNPGDMSVTQPHYQMAQFNNNISEMSPSVNLTWPHPQDTMMMPDLSMLPTSLNQSGHCLNTDEWTLDDVLKTEILDVPGLEDTPQSNTITPSTDHLEPVTPTQNPISLTAIPGAKLDTERPPKRHRLQVPQITDGPDGHLVSLLSDPTFKYQGHIVSLSHSFDLRQQYDRLSIQRGRNTTSPEQDESFPNTDDEFRGRIREIFEAICDWTDLREWRAKMGQKRVREWLAEVAQQRRSQGLDDDLSKLSDKELMPPANRMPSMKEQWKNVIHRTMSDIEIELLCAQILASPSPSLLHLTSNSATEPGHGCSKGPQHDSNDRILNAFRDNKVLIHSAIRAPWITRITNSPHSETRRKYQNKAGNDRKRTLIEQGGSEKKKAKAESMSPL